MTPKLFDIYSSAILSPCGLYRYSLTRLWDESKPGCLWIMLNPSIADADTDDPTIRRCMGFARAWGCGSITVVNLFAYRATDPALLTAAVRYMPRGAAGPDNDANIRRACINHSERGDYILTAWGAHAARKSLAWRRDEVMRLLPLADLCCLDVTVSGEPKHPLYCRGDLTPTKFEGSRQK